MLIRNFDWSTARLVTSNGEWGNGRWFLISKNQRREILSADALKNTKFERVNPEVTDDVAIKSLENLAKVGLTSTRLRTRNVTSSLKMREIATGGVSGVGIEFGAGASPLPVPLSCNVLYADVFEYEELISNPYPGQDIAEFVRPSIKASFDNIEQIEMNDLGFIIACHVIEHVANPIKAILDSLEKIAPGGKLILIVPEKRKTFDKKRKLTSIKHLVEDFFHPDSNRDFEHFVEFYNVAQPPEDLSQVEQVIQENFSNAFPIHYHTFTHRSFKKLLKAILKIQPNSFDFWIRKARFTKVDIEFYVVITKK